MNDVHCFLHGGIILPAKANNGPIINPAHTSNPIDATKIKVTRCFNPNSSRFFSAHCRKKIPRKRGSAASTIVMPIWADRPVLERDTMAWVMREQVVPKNKSPVILARYRALTLFWYLFRQRHIISRRPVRRGIIKGRATK